MGKSRLTDAVARVKFCFPFNIRGVVLLGQYGKKFIQFLVTSSSLILCSPAYPPSDIDIYDFFHYPDRRAGDEDEIECKYIAFFVALFECAVPELEKALDANPDPGSTIPERWHRYLGWGATADAVGRNREHFYKKVVDCAERVTISLFTYLQDN